MALDFTGALNKLAGTWGLEAQAAANAYAGLTGTNKRDLLGALNIKAGTSGLDLNDVCNRIAGTTTLDAQGALNAAIANLGGGIFDSTFRSTF